MHESLKKIFNRGYNDFFLISGPCVIESLEESSLICEELLRVCTIYNLPFIFKASFKKANRTRGDSFRGLEMSEALEILAELKKNYGIAISTDVHETKEVGVVAELVDLIQVPAFLSRQTELLEAAGSTGIPVNIKKAQFMDFQAARHALDKVKKTGNQNVMITERGTMFGYHDLVVDYRALYELSKDYITVMDCTHACQMPNSRDGITAGNKDYASLYARLALNVPCQGLFMETHPSPQKAKSDGSTMITLSEVEEMLGSLIKQKSHNN